MLSGLMLTAFLMGLAGIPHCAAMCGTACAALLRKPLPMAALVGRVVGYAVLGAVAATATTLAGQWSKQIAMLQPLWVLAQLAACMLGLWLLFTARMPVMIEQWAHDAYRAVQVRAGRQPASSSGGRASVLLPLLSGMAWAALPCGLLYGAVTVAALGNTPLDGALVMVSFAVPSALGLWAMPWLVAKARHQPVSAPAVVQGAGDGSMPLVFYRQQPNSLDSSEALPGGWQGMVLRLTDPRWAIRFAGLMLAIMAGWAVYHRLVDQWNAWCA